MTVKKILYRVIITYKLKYPNTDEYYTESETVYKEDYLQALSFFEKAKEFDNVSNLKLDKIFKMEEWESGA